jgi:pimeloyl-ACP methyl ester carboxylesterase
MTPRPTLYLLPGLLCDAAIWAHQSTALEQDCEIRIPDYTAFDTFAAMAQTVLDAAPERFSLAGHSMGGRVALEIFRRAPQRIERLALLDTGTHPPREGEAEKRQELLDLADRAGMAALADRWLPPMVHPERTEDPELMAGLRAMVQRMSPNIFRRQVAALLGRPDAGPLLAHIRCPTLIGVGRQDRWSPPAQHEPIAAAVPQARYVIFEDSGHMAPVEAPQAVSKALREWMLEPAGG